jgi:uncharacterized protein YecE (DUF72 family)
MAAEILVGTSGYSYQDWGGGKFYPVDIERGEILPFYARHFRVVEINRTYYGVPQPSVFSSMLERTPPDFTYAVKMNREMTHVTEGNEQVHDAFRAAITPFVEARRLGALLAQFPFSFHNNIRNQDYLIRLRELYSDVPLIFEFRNRSWFSSDVETYLREQKIGFCNVDEPDLGGLLPPTEAVTSDIGCIRFNSRDREKWFGNAGKERYDYFYSQAELREWVPRIRRMS